MVLGSYHREHHLVLPVGVGNLARQNTATYLGRRLLWASRVLFTIVRSRLVDIMANATEWSMPMGGMAAPAPASAPAPAPPTTQPIRRQPSGQPLAAKPQPVPAKGPDPVGPFVQAAHKGNLAEVERLISKVTILSNIVISQQFVPSNDILLGNLRNTASPGTQTPNKVVGRCLTTPPNMGGGGGGGQRLGPQSKGGGPRARAPPAGGYEG